MTGIRLLYITAVVLVNIYLIRNRKAVNRVIRDARRGYDNYGKRKLRECYKALDLEDYLN